MSVDLDNSIRKGMISLYLPISHRCALWNRNTGQWIRNYIWSMLIIFGRDITLSSTKQFEIDLRIPNLFHSVRFSYYNISISASYLRISTHLCRILISLCISSLTFLLSLIFSSSSSWLFDRNPFSPGVVPAEGVVGGIGFFLGETSRGFW